MAANLANFRARLRRSLRRNREAFEGIYKEEINALLGISREEIDRITPDITDLAIYDELISVVKEASRANITKSELKERIVELGSIAIEISKKVPTLASLFI